jgi:hypothetical protein
MGEGIRLKLGQVMLFNEMDRLTSLEHISIINKLEVVHRWLDILIIAAHYTIAWVISALNLNNLNHVLSLR